MFTTVQAIVLERSVAKRCKNSDLNHTSIIQRNMHSIQNTISRRMEHLLAVLLHQVAVHDGKLFDGRFQTVTKYFNKNKTIFRTGGFYITNNKRKRKSEHQTMPNSNMEKPAKHAITCEYKNFVLAPLVANRACPWFRVSRCWA